jgi:hypothetical protein
VSDSDWIGRNRTEISPLFHAETVGNRSTNCELKPAEKATLYIQLQGLKDTRTETGQLNERQPDEAGSKRAESVMPSEKSGALAVLPTREFYMNLYTTAAQSMANGRSHQSSPCRQRHESTCQHLHNLAPIYPRPASFILQTDSLLKTEGNSSRFTTVPVIPTESSVDFPSSVTLTTTAE